MRNLNLIFFFLLCVGSLFGQTVVSERTAELVNGNYEITGSATITEYDDGTATLSLSEDFDTPQGPDVRVYLNDQLNPNGATELVNLATISHFSGALTVDIPAGTDLEVNNQLVFYCFAFSQLWASGQFGEPVNPMPMDTCEASLTATFAWVTQIDLCTAVSGDTAIFVQNNIDVAPGETYAFLLTDTNEVVLEVVLDSLYTITPGMVSPLRFYGISYMGELNAAIGQNRLNTTATDCYIHSGGNIFLTVDPSGACEPSRVNEQLSNETQLFPNPVTNQLTIDFPTTFNLASIHVYDMTGKELLAQKAFGNRMQLNTTQLATGQYLLLATDDQGQQLRKRFVKK